ncbi:hypothetical protein DRW03_03365 [Corallococcus sp. H22C18031201]|nr:hypothetical protein DRW03_03365 [Corallococcus sp. H22C18031201]
MEPLACGHAAPIAGHACAHLIEAPGAPYTVRFTGQGQDHDLLCDDCDSPTAPARAELRPICAACQQAHLERLDDLIHALGRPEVRTRASALRFEHREHSLPELESATLLALEPLGSAPRSQWLAVTSTGDLLRLELEKPTTTRLGAVPAESLALSEPLAVHVSDCGHYAAVANATGSHGVVIALDSGAVTMKLDRGTYHVTHCQFPLAFFRDGDRTLLVHGTDWNQLDISDPSTGERLTPRPAEAAAATEDSEAHGLDYFHCGLSVSPDGQWLVDDGWVWHPVGILTRLSLRRWLHENVWESEDGPSRKSLRQVEYFWDGPRCFVGPRLLAVWGFGGTDRTLFAAALIIDLETGALRRWFPGPQGDFHCDGQFLLTSAGDEGTAVWDWETGERLHVDSTLKPTAWHPAARCFVSVIAPGQLRESRLAGTP